MGIQIGSLAGSAAGAVVAKVRRVSVRTRWASAGAVVAAGALLAGTVAASAAGPPPPPLTAAQLLAQLLQAKPPGPMTATVQETANLGFPALPDIPGMSSSSAFSAAALIAGIHEFDIWYGGPRQVRIAMPAKFAETDLRVNGSAVWLWQSQGQTATKIIGPAAPPKPATPGAGGSGGSGPLAGLTPAAAASKLLALAGPSTIVATAPSISVAGHSAYQLSVEPRSNQSLIGQILIAFDTTTMLPLQVVVTPRGSTTMAFEVTYSSLIYGAPAASNFSFTPPPGAKVKTVTLNGPATAAAGPAGILGGPLAGLTAPRPGKLVLGTLLSGGPPGSGKATVKVVTGSGGWVSWAGPVPPPQQLNRIIAKLGLHLTPAQLSQVRAGQLPLLKLLLAKRARAIQGPAGQVISGVPAPGVAPKVQVLGSGWLTVVALPSASVANGSLPALPALPAGASGLAAQLATLASTMMKSATAVTGPWGTGKLLSTTLFNVLITSKGQVLAGAVTPDVLYGDVSLVK